MDDSLLFNKFLFGVIVTACSVAGLFFLKFWRKTRDRLFIIFAIAFWTLGVNWLALAFIPRDPARPDDAELTSTILYIIRLLAFLLILFGIIDKNRAGRTASPTPTSL
jgi:hypothetical protein